MAAPHPAPTSQTRPVEVPRPRSSATSLGIGLFLLVLGGALTTFGMGSGLSAFGLLALLAGGIVLATGVHRAARNLDCLAAAAYNESLRRHD